MTGWKGWTPGRGDVVSVRAGDSERRPALVLSPAAYSAVTGFAVVCPVVGEAKGYPFEVDVAQRLPGPAVVLADRVTSLSILSSGMRLVCSAPDEVVAVVLERLALLVGEEPGTRS